MCGEYFDVGLAAAKTETWLAAVANSFRLRSCEMLPYSQ